jgi:hypothetical protein
MFKAVQMRASFSRASPLNDAAQQQFVQNNSEMCILKPSERGRRKEIDTNKREVQLEAHITMFTNSKEQCTAVIKKR